MRKFFYSTPLALIASLLFICGICYLMMNACRKMDHQSGRFKADNTERFLRLPSDAHPAVKKVATQMRRMNERNKFINDFVSKQGFAIWDKAIVIPHTNGNNASKLSGEETYSLMIPLVWDNGDMVHAAIAAKVTEDSVFFSLLDGSNYAVYNADSATKGLNGRQLSATLMYLDNHVFGHNVFDVKDSAAFPFKDSIVKYVQAPDSVIAATDSEERTVIISYVICYTVWVPPHNGQLVGCPPGTPDCNAYVPIHYCDFYNIIADDGYEYDDENPPPPPGSGEGGGGEGGNDYCRFFPGTEHNCGEGADPGWEPLDEETGGNPYDPYVYDSVRITRYLKDSFPCLYYFLKDSLKEANRIAQLAGIIFDDSVSVHVTFDISDSITQQGQAAAKTKSGPVFVDQWGTTQYVARIEFNPWYLKHGTKEYMVSTIVHELMHAVFHLRWGQYLKWLDEHDTIYDSGYIKQHFPNYWYQLTNQTVALTDLQQHEIMAADYSEMHADIVRPFFNPAAPVAIRDTVIKAMSYCGLRETTAWRMLPGLGADTCKYAGIQISAENSAPGNIYPPGCSGSNAYHYANDLKLRPSCN